MMSVAAGTTDSTLLDQLHRGGERAALAELNRRYIDFVYASAVRQCGDAAMAADVTQAVFLVLARRAGSIRGSALPAWLHRVTTYAVKNAQRSERRRRRHERAAAIERLEAVMPADASESIVHLLDRAIATLPKKDQAIVIERYLCGHQITQIAERLGISVDATQKRLERAIARLRRYFNRHGMVLGAGAIPWPPLHSTPVELSQRVVTNAASIQSKTLAGKVSMQLFWIKAAVITGAVGLAVVPLVVLAQSLIGATVQAPSGAPATPAVSVALANGSPILHLGDGTVFSIEGVFALGDTHRVWTANGKPTSQNAQWFPSVMNVAKVTSGGGKLDNFGIIFRLTSRPQHMPRVNVASVGGGAQGEGLLNPDVAAPDTPGEENSLGVAMISALPGQGSVDLQLQFTAPDFTPLERPPLGWGATGASTLVSAGPYGDCVISKPFLLDGTVAVILSSGISQEHRLVVRDGQSETIGRAVDGAGVGSVAQRTEVFDGFHDLNSFPPITVETQKLFEADVRNVSLSGAPTAFEMKPVGPMDEFLTTRPPAPPPANQIFISGEVDRPGVYTPSDELRSFSELAKAAGFHGRPEDSVTVIRHDRDQGESTWVSTVSALSARPEDEGLLEAGEEIVIRGAGR